MKAIPFYFRNERWGKNQNETQQTRKTNKKKTHNPFYTQPFHHVPCYLFADTQIKFPPPVPCCKRIK
ncbi:Hypothetical protein, putative [Bodo saltans]|uniref:Uncharacterized protein n=1 Tax=Bodo saltans TaxID=75058 RepID=A0A0S4JBU2_BODSA|nr:Hypothetical protein, putative [Bodo saltans]|eukprot:CUG87571.1 Hypothetical protein, putative [Bodo saltans]